MQTVLETPQFVKNADRLLTGQQHFDLVTRIAADPLAAPEIPETGGVRKLRFGLGGKGKRGGARVIYYVFDEDHPIYLITMYGKGERANLTPAETRQMKQLTTALKAAFRGRRK
jgi:hypothetical protein